jgi:hypothetical protein
MQERARLSPKARRILELAYAVEGVHDVRVWQWENNIAVGVRGLDQADSDLLLRLERKFAALREPEEQWEFGILEGES